MMVLPGVIMAIVGLVLWLRDDELVDAGPPIVDDADAYGAGIEGFGGPASLLSPAHGRSRDGERWDREYEATRRLADQEPGFLVQAYDDRARFMAALRNAQDVPHCHAPRRDECDGYYLGEVTHELPDPPTSGVHRGLPSLDEIAAGTKGGKSIPLKPLPPRDRVPL